MSDDEFCTQTDALAKQLGKLKEEGTPKVDTDQSVSKFIANEHVQLGRIVKPRRLEWVQELQFNFVHSVASNSNGLFAVCNSRTFIGWPRIVTIFQIVKSPFKIQQRVEFTCKSAHGIFVGEHP